MYYFASDMHLGHGSTESSLNRERLLVNWLEESAKDAEAIFLVGDVFDFWYEYRAVVPKGFTRLLGTLSRLTDRGVKIHFFPGNHDLWEFGYLHSECGLEIHHAPEVFELYGKRVLIAHGDNLNVKDRPMLRFMNGVFRSNPLQWLFSHLIHPDCALRLGHCWSDHSRKSKAITHTFLGEQEPLVGYARQVLQRMPVDYFVFGHTHCMADYQVADDCRAVFLGEWIERPCQAQLSSDGEMRLLPVSQELPAE